MEDKKSYYAVVTAEVRYDHRLSPSMKLLYGELTALANEKGFSWASNGYFAKLYGVHKNTVSNWISTLKKYGYVNISEVPQQNGLIERRINITQKMKGDIENPEGVSMKSIKGVNDKTDHNITLNNKKNNKRGEGASKAPLSGDFDTEESPEGLLKKQATPKEKEINSSSGKAHTSAASQPLSDYLDDYNAYCRHMGVGKIQKKDVSDWSPKDFVNYLYCGMFHLNGKGTMPSYGPDCGKMKNYMSKYDNERLKRIIKTLVLNQNEIKRRLPKKNVEINISILGVAFIVDAVETLADERDEREKAARIHQEFKIADAEASALVKSNRPEMLERLRKNQSENNNQRSMI